MIVFGVEPRHLSDGRVWRKAKACLGSTNILFTYVGCVLFSSYLYCI
jgi:hypothetical protein